MEKTVLDVTGLLCPLPVLKAKKISADVATRRTFTSHDD